jgi:hypothetical protein
MSLFFLTFILPLTACLKVINEMPKSLLIGFVEMVILCTFCFFKTIDFFVNKP